MSCYLLCVSASASEIEEAGAAELQMQIQDKRIGSHWHTRRRQSYSTAELFPWLLPRRGVHVSYGAYGTNQTDAPRVLSAFFLFPCSCSLSTACVVHGSRSCRLPLGF
jgi:hypothetical protein